MLDYIAEMNPTLVMIIVMSIGLSIVFYFLNVLDYFLYILSVFYFMLGVLLGLLGDGRLFLISGGSGLLIFGTLLLYRKIKDH